MNTETIRQFNRYYARVLGVFDQHVFDLDYSMFEMRLLGEIARRPGTTANWLGLFLNSDKGYVSRTIKKLEKNHLIYREKDLKDNRLSHLYLTSEGEKTHRYVEVCSDRQVTELLQGLSAKTVSQVEEAMKIIEHSLYQVVPEEVEESDAFV